MKLSKKFIKEYKFKIKRTNSKRLIFLILFFGMTVNPVSAEVISNELAKFTAQDYVDSQYGGGDYITRITYYDFNDEPNAYTFIFNRPNNPETTLLDIEQKTSANYQKYYELKQELRDLKNSQSEPELIAAKKQEMKESNRILRGRGRYITVLVGANEQKTPVIHSYMGLPYSIYQKPLITQRLSKDINYVNLILRDKIYFVSKIKQYFSFSDQQSGSVSNAVYIAPIGSKKLELKPQGQIAQQAPSLSLKTLKKNERTEKEYQWEVMRILKEQMGVK